MTDAKEQLGYCSALSAKMGDPRGLGPLGLAALTGVFDG